MDPFTFNPGSCKESCGVVWGLCVPWTHCIVPSDSRNFFGQECHGNVEDGESGSMKHRHGSTYPYKLFQLLSSSIFCRRIFQLHYGLLLGIGLQGQH